jgi:hypothetical protein
MKISRGKFVLLFLACGFAYTTATRLILNQMPASLYGSDFARVPQAAWQSTASLLLSPVKFVVVGPLRPLFVWMLSQDGDPPPPMLMLLFMLYWTILALIVHYILGKLKPQKTSVAGGK